MLLGVSVFWGLGVVCCRASGFLCVWHLKPEYIEPPFRVPLKVVEALCRLSAGFCECRVLNQ